MPDNQKIEDEDDHIELAATDLNGENDDDAINHNEDKYSVIFGCCGKSKRSQPPIARRNFHIDKGSLTTEALFAQPGQHMLFSN
jgi:hypothetical protein